MRTARFTLAVAAFLAAACAQGNLLDQPSPPLLEKTGEAEPRAFAGSFRPFPRLYTGENETRTAYDTVFDSYRADPKLMVGVELHPNLAIEAGYANLFSRGFHFVEYGRSYERAGALGTKGFSSYVAGKFTLPLGEQLFAYGKLGVAYSQRVAHDRAGSEATELDLGTYANIGARYKFNDSSPSAVS